MYTTFTDLCPHTLAVPWVSVKYAHGYLSCSQSFNKVWKKTMASYTSLIFLLCSFIILTLSSVQFSHSATSDSLQPRGLQHARFPCPSPNPGAYSNSCPLSWWCHPTISSSWWWGREEGLDSGCAPEVKSIGLTDRLEAEAEEEWVVVPLTELGQTGGENSGERTSKPLFYYKKC